MAQPRGGKRIIHPLSSTLLSVEPNECLRNGESSQCGEGSRQFPIVAVSNGIVSHERNASQGKKCIRPYDFLVLFSSDNHLHLSFLLEKSGL